MEWGRVLIRSDRNAYRGASEISRRKAKSENIVSAPLFLRSRLRFRTWLFYLLNGDYSLVSEYRLIGECGARYLRNFLRKAHLDKIEALRLGTNTYLHVKNLPTVGFFFPRDLAAAAFRDTGLATLNKRFQNTEVIVAGLAHLLGAHVRRRFEQPDQSVGRDLRTAPDEPQIGDRDGSDMPLRFHQSTVEFQLPVETMTQGPGHESCRYKIYVGVNNGRSIPIYLIPVREVVAQIHPDDPAKRQGVLDELMKAQFRKQAPTWDVTERAEAVTGEILKEVTAADGTPDWFMCFDPERVRVPDGGKVEAHNAVRQLRAALIRCRRRAIRVVVDRGDILIVDNQRALVSRREYYPRTLSDIIRLVLFRRPRWLRLYYAFRAPKKAKA